MENRQQRITRCLTETLSLQHLEVCNESHQHSVPVNAETHFKVTAVSDDFARLSSVKRHQWLYQLLEQEFKNGLHALSLQLFTPQEWTARGGKVAESPLCHGGSKHEGE